jgi:hypothetical protein
MNREMREERGEAMKIFLQAIETNGNYLEIGSYLSPAVPRVGETISLQLVARPPYPDPDQPYPSRVRLRVVGVEYQASNHMTISEDTQPYPQDVQSLDVGVEVRPDDEDARKYFAYLDKK